MVVDLWKKKAINIMKEEVETVHSYLGVHLNDTLNWRTNSDSGKRKLCTKKRLQQRDLVL